MWTEPLNLIDNRRDHGLWGQVSMPLQRFDQPLFSELLFGIVERFGYSVGVEDERVSRVEPALRYRAIPLFKNSQYRRSGTEPFNGTVAPQKQRREMPTVHIA